MLSFVGSMLSAQGQLDAGKTAKASSLYNAGQNELQAKLAVDQGQEALRRLKIQEDQTQGAVQAGFASGGIDTTTGSPLLVMANNAREFALSRLRIQANEDLNVQQDLNAASFNRYLGNKAQQNSYLQAGGTLLGGVATGLNASDTSTVSTLGGGRNAPITRGDYASDWWG